VNFLNLAQSNLGLRLFPTFGDLNGDGKADMMLGLENGSVAYYQNTTTGSNPTFAAPVLNYADQTGTAMNAGQYASPQLFDLNNDGKLDLILGKKTGELIYFENTGTTTSPSFTLLNNALGMVDTDSLTPDGYSVPHFFRFQDTTYLLLGAHDGAIHFYDSIDGSLNTGLSFHERSADFLGLKQDLGGIYRLEDEPGSTLEIEEDQGQNLRIFPNPATTEITILCDKNLGVMDMYSLEGKWMCSWDVSNGINLFSLADLESGFYILKGRTTGVNQKFWKR
jgi:hypothetical protein